MALEVFLNLALLISYFIHDRCTRSSDPDTSTFLKKASFISRDTTDVLWNLDVEKQRGFVGKARVSKW